MNSFIPCPYCHTWNIFPLEVYLKTQPFLRWIITTCGKCHNKFTHIKDETHEVAAFLGQIKLCSQVQPSEYLSRDNFQQVGFN